MALYKTFVQGDCVITNARTAEMAKLEAGQESGPERGVDLVDLDTARTTADLHVMLVGHREFKDAAPPQGHLVDAQGVWRPA